MQNRRVGVVGKADLSQLNLAGNRPHRLARRGIGDGGLGLQQAEHAFATGHCLLHRGIELAHLLDRLKEARDIG